VESEVGLPWGYELIERPKRKQNLPMSMYSRGSGIQDPRSGMGAKKTERHPHGGEGEGDPHTKIDGQSGKCKWVGLGCGEGGAGEGREGR
jgi:hypothetical protein